MYGSNGQSFVSPGTGSAAHLLGNWKPENPPVTLMVATCRQALQVIWSLDARDVRTEAEITIPGSLTSLEI